MLTARMQDLQEQWVEGRADLRFAAVYASADVVTRYEDVVQPSGERESQTIG